MRISDWSSDVCSSDLPGLLPTPIPNSVRAALRDVTIDAGPGSPEIDPDWGEPGLTPVERVYAWNTFEVLAFSTGNPGQPVNARSEERRVGKECVSKCRARWSPDHYKNKINTNK